MVFSSSPVNRVLEIPELLNMIIGCLDNSSNVANALVCKRWSEVALDKIWRDLDDLSRLFGVLKPLKQLGEVPDTPWSWTVPPDADDWRRLERYSRRVRRLAYNANSGRPLCPTVFEDVARTRTSLNIFPNLNMLLWHAPLALSVMFMHNSVKHMVLCLPYEDKEAIPAFFRDITSRMPHLTTLDIRTDIPMHDNEDNMLFLLQNLKKLRKIIFPRFQLSTRVAEALARLEDLGCIEFQYFHEQGCGEAVDVEVFRPRLHSGAFPSLWDLSFTVTLTDAAEFMKQPFAPTNITALYIDSRLMESPDTVHDLLALLADSCQLLESLGIITLVDSETVPKLADVPPSERVNFSTLRPLQNFPNLNIFEIIHQYPVDISLEDLEQLARSWPSLKKLILNNEPVVSDECSLTLSAFIPFARHCPELEQLGLFINASTADLPGTYTTELPPTYQSKPFAKLRRLSMGVSLIHDDGAIALFLSQICPLSTSLESGITWDSWDFIDPQNSSSPSVQLYETIKDRCTKWTKVGELLPLLTKLRMEERERTRHLMRELQDLRMRGGLLADKLGGKGPDSCVML